MNAPRLTDAQVSQALRAHLPDGALAGLRERILEAAETTTQQRALPSFLGALSEADPVSRRRSLLIAAAILVALALASAAAVGALRLLQRDPLDELSLEPPADLPAFVLSSYERLPQLPPVALAWHDSDSAKGRIYVHRSGAVRFDRFTSAEATEPSSYTILSSNHTVSGVALVESEAVWVEEGHEAIGDDPRVFLRTILNAADGPGCEMERDPSGVGSGTAATGWRYVGVEYVAGRPTHHVACVGELSLDIDLWLDIETRLILRTREPLSDDAGQPIPGQFGTTEVTEIAFGEQPAALFEPPEGVTRMSPDAYGAYLCTRDLPDEEVVGLGRSDCNRSPAAEAAPIPTPIPTARPSVGPRPSGPPGPLAWSEASLKDDWPAPIRPEPDGGAIVLPILLNVVPDAEGCCKIREFGRYSDPPGDTGSDVLPWADIKAVTFCGSACMSIGLASDSLFGRGGPPVVDPIEQWIAHGVVVDDDRDGVPDWRYGIDNMPVHATGGDPSWVAHRRWRTDLHTGRTESVVGNSPWLPSETMFYGEPGRLSFGGYAAGVGPFGGVPERFYAWASVIQDGRVVSTDYAPDVGWLEPSPKASGIDAGEVAPPIDSLEEAIAAVGEADSSFLDFKPLDRNDIGASAWVEGEARGDSYWDLTFVRVSGDCPADCVNRAYAKIYVGWDGTVEPRCEWQEGEEAAGTPC
jgi:hypothetical protein